MRNIRCFLSYGTANLSRQFWRPLLIQNFSASSVLGTDGRRNVFSSESIDDLERVSSSGSTPNLSGFYKKLDMAEKAVHDVYGLGSKFNIRNKFKFMDGQDGSYNTLDEGMNGRFKQAPTYFEYDPSEVNQDDYAFRPDVNFVSGMTYDTKDLDLRKPGVRRPVKRNEFETTSEEVLRNADFRNVRFLANFITEAGIIIKRSKTGISAKAQRKVAREIKTARAFGLMPFTTMGTKQFTFGRTMEDGDDDFKYERYGPNFVDDGRSDPLDT